MKIRYKDPYEKYVEVELPDDTPQEELDEILAFLNENARLTINAEARENYHAPYHHDACDYEGLAYAYYDTPERILIRNEDNERLYSAFEQLTDRQKYRVFFREMGLNVREIAEIEGVDFGSVAESLRAAKKNFLKNY